jgi:uracil-DNA glycosylase family 4
MNRLSRHEELDGEPQVLDSAINTVAALNEAIVRCRHCPRLVDWREKVALEKRKAFMDWDYWGKPVPYFGDPDAERLIVGLAPAAHGANRTGRMFTGDRSGDWLFRALHRAGIASQPESQSTGDGLVLKGVLIAATAHCAPPDNKPLPSEIANCSEYLRRLFAIRKWSSVLCLGGIAWDHVHRLLEIPKQPFAHAAVQELEGKPRLVASYHPSQQNTFTGRLTEPMLDNAIDLWLRVSTR